jgi:hypothetical protein
MAEGKNTIVFYRDWKDIFESLQDKDCAALIRHIFRYVNDENPETDNEVVNAVFIPIRNTLKRDLKKWETICERNKINGSKGGRPKNPKEPIKPSGLSGNPNKPKKPDSDSDIDIDKEVNNNINIYYLKNRDYLKKLQSYLEAERINYTLKELIEKAETFITKKEVELDTQKPFPEYASHFNNLLKKEKSVSKKNNSKNINSIWD